MDRPSVVVPGTELEGADGVLIPSDELLTPPDPALDATVPVDLVNSSNAQASNKKAHPHERPLVLYAYSESPEARVNLKFFIKHGLQSTSDFVIIFNGFTNANHLFPKPVPANVQIIQKQSECYDLGAQAKVLLENHKELLKKYKKFILMNANVRGPFLPSWSKQCWTEGYTSNLKDNVKVCGNISFLIELGRSLLVV